MDDKEAKSGDKPTRNSNADKASEPDPAVKREPQSKAAHQESGGESKRRESRSNAEESKKPDEPKKPGSQEKETSSAPANPELESYKKLRKNLKDLIAKKIKLDQELEETEERLYVEEGTYLQEASAGNIAKGFEQYTKSSQNRRKSVLVEQDRVFSQSSTSFDAEM